MHCLFVFLLLATVLACAVAQYWPGYAGLPYRAAAYPYAAGYPYTAGLYAGGYYPYGYGYSTAWGYK
ncbi:hypothetical protein AVEN_227239-1 [Araneus ventricosus]|uniref:Uncharacterized protein n=1 Tax=Araneus ventricosus TaxID=182803 RepID=A0A4Y2IQ04_ARAVE|nr:hypothetical protein AVEN_227239-1 [Araneus ventricosus]